MKRAIYLCKQRTLHNSINTTNTSQCKNLSYRWQTRYDLCKSSGRLTLKIRHFPYT